MPTRREALTWTVAGAGVLTMASVAAVVTVWPEPVPPPHPPPEPSPSGIPPVRPEPELPAGQHPVVVHDVDEGDASETRRPDPEALDVDLHVIEVYETGTNHSHGHHPTGATDVYVHAVERPLVLVLEAYEPTVWRIHADDGVRIPLVVADGYHQQQVTGVDADCEVVTRANWPGLPDPDLAGLAAEEPTSRTYAYTAALFSVRP
ncbi:MAG: hypothetical protein ACTH2Q_02815 [Propionibacteriaceae bacterium]